MSGENSGISNQIVSIISIVLSSIGIIGNIISILICLRKELRKTPTFMFMAFISGVNIFKLFTTIICILMIQFQIQEIKELNIVFLNTCLFLIFWKHHSSVYLMIITLFDQLMCIKHVLWRKTLFNNKKAFYLITLIMSTFFFSNLHLNFTIKYKNIENAANIVDFIRSSKTIVFWMKVSFFFFF
jgi:hypothetical protein